MATLLDRYNEDNTVRTQILSVEKAPDFWAFPILKSTDVYLPEGLKFVNEKGEKLGDVREIEGVLYAPVQTFITTIEQVKENKRNYLEQTADSKANAIKPREANRDELIEAINVQLAGFLSELEEATTIQDAEAVVWVD